MSNYYYTMNKPITTAKSGPKKRMTALQKNIFLLLLSLVIIFTFRAAWLYVYMTPEQPEAKGGILDLTNWDFSIPHSIALNGEWNFFPNQLLNGSEVKNKTSVSLQVPSRWSEALGHPATMKGFGTYQLTVLLDQPIEEPYVLWFDLIHASSKVFINGELLAQFGEPAETQSDYLARIMPFTITHYAKDITQLDIVIQTANHDSTYYGGLENPIRFAKQSVIDNERWYSIGFQLTVFVILMLHAFYAVILLIIMPKAREILYFLILLFIAAITVIADHDQLLFNWLPINYTWSVKIKALSYLWLTYFLLLLAKNITGYEKKLKAISLYQIIIIAYTLFILIASVDAVMGSLYYNVFVILYLFPLPFVVYFFSRFVMRNQQGALFLLISTASVISSIIWGIVRQSNFMVNVYYPVEVIAAITGFSAYWFKKYWRNVNENIHLNNKLQQSDKMKDQFLANTSHELRTPLHGILNIAQTILRKEKHLLSESSVKDLDLLVQISSRMSYLIEDLLDITQLQEKKIYLNKDAVMLQSVVPGTVAMLQYLVANKPVQLQIQIPSGLPSIYADEKRLVQILFNLLHNAIKYTDEGTIIIQAEQINEHIIITVSDTGHGMDALTLARIFSPYEQGALGMSHSGIGLGLSISKQLVELHDSELLAISEEGKGSSFQFKIDIAKAVPDSLLVANDLAVKYIQQQEQTVSRLLSQEQASAVNALTGAGMHSITNKQGHINILVVDDDPVNLKVLTDILGTENYNVTTVSSPKDALPLLFSGNWHLVILDVMMPHMSGYELTRKIREQLSIAELPILLLTARSKPPDVYAGFVSGANDYVTKPVNAIELKYRVWSLTALKLAVDDRLRLEAAYLQAQIHPHFLFNTLNSIMALSRINTEKMHQLCDAFTSYLRISFDFLNAGEAVSLTHELKLVRAYLYIEQERFDNRLRVEWNISPNIELQLPPLTLQPIVENAVRHGLLKLKQGGIISIRIVEQEAFTLFEVADNGVGMEPNQIRQMLDIVRIGKSGIGLYNTNRRLIQRYGKGLHIESQPGKGTLVSFTIPRNK